MNNRKGVTILELLVVLAVMAVISTLVVGGVARSQRTKRLQSIAIDKGTLETQCQRYYLDNTVYPHLPEPLVNDIMKAESDKEEKQVELYKKLTMGDAYEHGGEWNGFSEARVQEDFRVIDVNLLINNDYIRGLANPEEQFIIDTKTGNVYHWEDTIEDILATITDNEDLDNVVLEADNYIIEIKDNAGNQMDEIHYMLDVGSGMLVGGKGAITLAYVSADTHTVTNYSDRLEGGADEVYFIAKSGNSYKIVGRSGEDEKIWTIKLQ